MGLVFDSDRIVMCTAKQKRYVRNLVKQYPSLGEPADYEGHTIRAWLDRAREALGGTAGHSLLPSPTDPQPELTPDRLLADLIGGDPLDSMLRDEYRNAVYGGL